MTEDMDSVTSGALSFDDDQADEFDQTKNTESKPRTTTPGGEKEVKWQVVMETAGLLPAQVIANRLRSEGIPARAWQEGAGQVFGLTVGLLGTGYVVVPESFAEQAKEILATTPEFDEKAFDEFEEDLPPDA